MNGFEIWLPLILVLVMLAFRIPVCMAFIGGAVFFFAVIAPEMPLNVVLNNHIKLYKNQQKELF